jgi:hypothetical protein
LASWEPASNETVFNISQCQGKTNRSCAIIQSDPDKNSPVVRTTFYQALFLFRWLVLVWG